MTTNKKLKIIILGYGIQGKKRALAVRNNLISIIDPIAPEADAKDIKRIPIKDYDAAIVCTGDKEKINLLKYLLKNKKHVLVEKPLISNSTKDIAELADIASFNKVNCYTAYNHRFEPHFIKMKKILQSNKLGKIYNIRIFYGNGTARLVKMSPWRDKHSGVLTDLGSHLLDTLDFWIEDIRSYKFNIIRASKFENNSFDHVIVNSQNIDKPLIQLEMSMLSWRNTFSCDIYGEFGSAHIKSLCKWGPSELIYRKRVFPSGHPIEKKEVIVKNDPTWKLECKYFINLCNENQNFTLNKDVWINETLLKLSQEAKINNII